MNQQIDFTNTKGFESYVHQRLQRAHSSAMIAQIAAEAKANMEAEAERQAAAGTICGEKSTKASLCTKPKAHDGPHSMWMLDGSFENWG
jgi:hypothetical protein